MARMAPPSPTPSELDSAEFLRLSPSLSHASMACARPTSAFPTTSKRLNAPSSPASPYVGPSSHAFAQAEKIAALDFSFAGALLEQREREQLRAERESIRRRAEEVSRQADNKRSQRENDQFQHQLRRQSVDDQPSTRAFGDEIHNRGARPANLLRKKSIARKLQVPACGPDAAHPTSPTADKTPTASNALPAPARAVPHASTSASSGPAKLTKAVRPQDQQNSAQRSSRSHSRSRSWFRSLSASAQPPPPSQPSPPLPARIAPSASLPQMASSLPKQLPMAPRRKSDKGKSVPASQTMKRRPSMPEIALKALVSFGRSKDATDVISDAELDSWRKPKIVAVQPYELSADLDELSLQGEREEVLDLGDDDEREDDILVISRAASPAFDLPAKDQPSSSTETSPLSPSFRFPSAPSEALSSASSASLRDTHRHSAHKSAESLPASPPESPETHTRRQSFRRSGSAVFTSSNPLRPRPSLSSTDLSQASGLAPPPRRKKPLPPLPLGTDDVKPPVPPRRLIDSKAWKQVSLTESSADARKAEFVKWKNRDDDNSIQNRAAMTPPSTPPKDRQRPSQPVISRTNSEERNKIFDDRVETPEAPFQHFEALLA